jgi:hypothetical protein
MSCFIVGQRAPVREQLCNQNFNALSCRSTPFTTVNDGESYGSRVGRLSQTGHYKRFSDTFLVRLSTPDLSLPIACPDLDNSSRTSSLALRLRCVASEQQKRARKALPSFSKCVRGADSVAFPMRDSWIPPFGSTWWSRGLTAYVRPFYFCASWSSPMFAPETVPVNSPVAANNTGLPRASDATALTVSVIVRTPDASLKRPVPLVI